MVLKRKQGGLLGKKKLSTPRSKVKAALRLLWLRSRERAAAIKRDGYTCQCCGKKQSRAKGKEVYVEVHHLSGIKWDYLLNEVFRVLLVDPERLQTLCKDCHKETE
jgi:5-methylcytosine-specific restriction endonuclease McrA